MIPKRDRKGIALIAVVLISGLILASIVGITLGVVPEYKMVVARSTSQRALTAAETGLSQVLFNLRNADFSKTDPTATAPGNDTVAYLTIADVRAIAMADASLSTVALPSDGRPSYGEHTVPDGSGTPYVTYEVKIQKLSGKAFDTATVGPLLGELKIHSLGTVWSDSQKTTVLARRVIEAQCSIAFKMGGGGSGELRSVDLKYGMITGTSITFDSNATRVLHGGVWAGGDITKGPNANKSSIILDGIAYASGRVDSGIVPAADPPKYEEGVPSPNTTLTTLFNTLNTNYPKNSALAFRTGGTPFDGTVPGNSNTNTGKYSPTLNSTDAQTVQSILDHYLKSTDFSTFASFYTDLKTPSTMYNPLPQHPLSTPLPQSVIGFFTSLNGVRDKMFTYFNGDVSLTGNANLADLCGAIFIDGSLSVNNGTLGDDSKVSPNRLTLRVTHDVSLNGGTVNANIYASGEYPTIKHNGAVTPVGVGNCTLNGYLVTPLDISVSGTVYCNGSLITKQSTDVTGTVDVTYIERGLGTITIDQPPPEPEPTYLEDVASADTTSPSWKEVSFDEFNNP